DFVGERHDAARNRGHGEGREEGRVGRVARARRVWQMHRTNSVRFVASVTFFVTAIITAPPALPGQAPAQRKARLFPPLDLGLLEAPDRDLWQKPDQIMDALKIAEGSVVAEIGAAGGWFTIHLARRVGPNGRVY